jgi:hypothetical protein
MASVSDCGADLRKSKLGIVAEHAANIRPHAMTAMTRLMIPTPLGGIGRLLPQNTTIDYSRENPLNLGPLTSKHDGDNVK